MTKAEKNKAIENLVDTHTKEELIDLAEGAGVSTSGTKEEIATALVEAEAVDESDADADADADESEANEVGEVEPPPVTDQTQEAAMRADAAARKEKWIKSGGNPDAPIPEDFGEEKEEGEPKEQEADEEKE